MKKSKKILACFSMLAGLSLFMSCRGEKFPEHEITMICPWAEGGESDSLIRLLSKNAEEYLKSPILIQNRTGASGLIAFSALKNSSPDGYTGGLISSELTYLALQKENKINLDDFDPLLLISWNPACLLVGADSAFNSLSEFLEYCKKNPGKVKIGNPSPSSIWQLCARILSSKTGIPFIHESFEGISATIQAISSSSVDAAILSATDAKKYADSGRVKVLGIMDSKKCELFPQVRTFEEEKLPLVFASWRGIALPKGCDGKRRSLIAEAYKKAMEKPDFIEKASKLNLLPVYKGDKEFYNFLRENSADLEKALQ